MRVRKIPNITRGEEKGYVRFLLETHKNDTWAIENPRFLATSSILYNIIKAPVYKIWNESGVYIPTNNLRVRFTRIRVFPAMGIFN